MNVERYDIFFADLNPTMGSELQKIRPVVVVSRNEMNKNLDTVVICPLTSQLHSAWRSRIQIQCGGKPAEIAVDQIRTVSKKRLKNKIDHLSDIPARTLRLLITEMYGE
jgi:mRNA interferase MazF